MRNLLSILFPVLLAATTPSLLPAEPADVLRDALTREGKFQVPEGVDEVEKIIVTFDGGNLDEVLARLREEGFLIDPGVVERVERELPAAKGRKPHDQAWDIATVHFPELVLESQELQARSQEDSLTPEQREHLRGILLEIESLGRQLLNAREQRPEVFDLVVEELRLDRELAALSIQYHETESEQERERLGQSMKLLLEKAFLVSQRLRENEAKQIEAELVRIRALLREREQNREIIVQRRLQEMLKGVDPYAW